jgi:hypothetical protein
MVTRSLCLLSLLALSASAQTPRIPPPESVNRNGLVLDLIGDGGITSSGVYDFSGRGNSGTNFNSITYSRPLRTAGYFGGATQFIHVPDSSTLRFGAGSFTVTAWVWPKDNSTRGVLSKYRVSGGEIGWSLELLFSGSQSVRFYAYKGSGGATDVRALYTLPLTHWTHIAAVRNASKTNISIYINGVLATNGTDTAIGSLDSVTPLRVGDKVSDTYNAYFYGWIARPRIYNRALSAAEIAAIYRGVQ